MSNSTADYPMSLVRYYYHDYWQNVGHPITGKLPLVDGGPWNVFVIIFLYVMFVKYWGPAFMKSRPPFDLRRVMIVHNIVLVLINGICFSIAIPYSNWGLSTWQCRHYDHTSHEFKEHLLMGLGYFYYITKFMDLLDTVFFVLRKKSNQVSGLHVFHHSAMPVAGWIGLKFSAYHCAGFVPFINAFIHTIMYSYYTMSALGMNKILRWKKYITQMQMAQFVLILIHSVYFLSSTTCNWPKIFPMLEFFHGILFFNLFFNFYRRTYGASAKVPGAVGGKVPAVAGNGKVD